MEDLSVSSKEEAQREGSVAVYLLKGGVCDLNRTVGGNAHCTPSLYLRSTPSHTHTSEFFPILALKSPRIMILSFGNISGGGLIFGFVGEPNMLQKEKSSNKLSDKIYRTWVSGKYGARSVCS
ncbi:hypothetical protein WUBG_00462 [Wuchereria bancrofti]|uniref:Uncharacterized protein n=1 Tax=Wuchereria bancrofti TaxID=6293 RepID=J9F163_WUCBA|nr:hypothetical protein WUBG_00462 [Wuchereria bancrofti]